VAKCDHRTKLRDGRDPDETPLIRHQSWRSAPKKVRKGSALIKTPLRGRPQSGSKVGLQPVARVFERHPPDFTRV
jgi:hypothetical protein